MANDHWSDALAAGDFNCDSYDDLVIGAPRKSSASLVSILYGTSGGITSVGDQFLSREGGFGAALAAGNFDGDQDNDIDCDDLIVAAPFAQASTASDEGVVHRFAGAVSGIDTQPTQTIHQDVTGVVDTPEAADFFGWRLAVVNADNNVYDDLFVTVHGDACSGSAGSGRHSFFGSSSGLTMSGNVIHCDTYACSLYDNGTLGCHSGGPPVYGRITNDVISTGASTGFVWGGDGDDAIYGGAGGDLSSPEATTILSQPDPVATWSSGTAGGGALLHFAGRSRRSVTAVRVATAKPDQACHFSTRGLVFSGTRAVADSL